MLSNRMRALQPRRGECDCRPAPMLVFFHSYKNPVLADGRPAYFLVTFLRLAFLPPTALRFLAMCMRAFFLRLARLPLPDPMARFFANFGEHPYPRVSLARCGGGVCLRRCPVSPASMRALCFRTKKRTANLWRPGRISLRDLS